MKPAYRSVLLAGLGTLVLGFVPSCNDDPDVPDHSSLRRSGAAAFVCVGPDGRGASIERCPQGPRTNTGGLTVAAAGYELFGLVTQTISAEVAVVRVTGIDENGFDAGRVLDADRSNPGVTPLRVGQKPESIVSTPGGEATFVSVSEVGKEGIFGLPTSCIFEPGLRADGTPETARDLTTWPACSLPSAPGAMVLLVDPADADGRMRRSCGGPYVEPSSLPPPASSTRDECAVDLFGEAGPRGMRKLVVALPNEGRLVVLDAQALLDREPGSYASCLADDVLVGDAPIHEGALTLQVNLPPEVTQPLPSDLVVPGCTEPTARYGPFPTGVTPRPAGMATRDGMLLVADRATPAVHVVDVHDPCALTELAPLVATSYEQPERVVTTSRVAISPRTPDGHRYAYAVDELGEEQASVMVFDLTPGVVSRTPLVRPGSVDAFLEPPDRIEFGSPVKDVAFALFDQPEIDVATGVGTVGTLCDPDPRASSASLGASYRSSNDFITGAAPRKLRGLFGYALLGSGSLALIDIEDFDARCRRPHVANPDSVSDWRGCVGDPPGITHYTLDQEPGGTPTVSDEVSCNTVEPHRARSGNILTIAENLAGADVPRLSSFGVLSQFGRSLPTSRLTPEGRRRPTLLGVDFEGTPSNRTAPAEVYVGTTKRSRTNPDALLEIDPNEAERPSLVLPMSEPRAYPTTEVVSIAYEGDYSGERRTGQVLSSDDLADLGALGTSRGDVIIPFEDAEALFCDAGVQDEALTRQLAEEQFGLGGGALDRFVAEHVDYVQITSELLRESDPYWRDEEGGALCGDGLGYQACHAVFGDGDVDELDVHRDFRIVTAYQDRLEVAAMSETGEAADNLIELLSCCFPRVVSYRLRAGKQWVVRGDATGYRHPVEGRLETDPNTGEARYRCVKTCDPRLSSFSGRAFEVSNVRCDETNPDDEDACGVGPRTERDVVCSYDGSSGPIEPGGQASECIYSAINRRFVVYRGLEPSERGMVFGFQVEGGFQGQGLSLTRVLGTTNILPVSLTTLPSFAGMAIVDSQDRGLILVDLRTATVADAFY